MLNDDSNRPSLDSNRKISDINSNDNREANATSQEALQERLAKLRRSGKITLPQAIDSAVHSNSPFDQGNDAPSASPLHVAKGPSTPFDEKEMMFNTSRNPNMSLLKNHQGRESRKSGRHTSPLKKAENNSSNFSVKKKHAAVMEPKETDQKSLKMVSKSNSSVVPSRADSEKSSVIASILTPDPPRIKQQTQLANLHPLHKNVLSVESLDTPVIEKTSLIDLMRRRKEGFELNSPLHEWELENQDNNAKDASLVVTLTLSEAYKDPVEVEKIKNSSKEMMTPDSPLKRRRSSRETKEEPKSTKTSIAPSVLTNTRRSSQESKSLSRRSTAPRSNQPSNETDASSITPNATTQSVGTPQNTPSQLPTAPSQPTTPAAPLPPSIVGTPSTETESTNQAAMNLQTYMKRVSERQAKRSNSFEVDKKETENQVNTKRYRASNEKFQSNSSNTLTQQRDAASLVERARSMKHQGDAFKESIEEKLSFYVCYLAAMCVYLEAYDLQDGTNSKITLDMKATIRHWQDVYDFFKSNVPRSKDTVPVIIALWQKALAVMCYRRDVRKLLWLKKNGTLFSYALREVIPGGDTTVETVSLGVKTCRDLISYFDRLKEYSDAAIGADSVSGQGGTAQKLWTEAEEQFASPSGLYYSSPISAVVQHLRDALNEHFADIVRIQSLF